MNEWDGVWRKKQRRRTVAEQSGLNLLFLATEWCCKKKKKRSSYWQTAFDRSLCSSPLCLHILTLRVQAVKERANQRERETYIRNGQTFKWLSKKKEKDEIESLNLRRINLVKMRLSKNELLLLQWKYDQEFKYIIKETKEKQLLTQTFLQVEPWRLLRGLWVLLLGRRATLGGICMCAKHRPVLGRCALFKKSVRLRRRRAPCKWMPRSPAANRVKRAIWHRAKHCGKYVKFLFPFWSGRW